MNDARIAADREAGVRRRIEDMKKTVVSSAPDTAKLAQLENQAKAKRSELERLQKQYEAAASSAGAGVGSVEVEIVSRAYPSNEKVFPKIGTMSALAAFGAFILSFALTLTRELVRGARPAAPRVERMVAAAAPTMVQQAQVKPTAARAATKEAIGLLTPAAAAQSLADLAVEARGFRVLIAPEAPAGEAETEALAVATALANTGKKTILVSWAGGNDGLARAAGVSGSIGTTQLLAGAASIEDAAQRMANSGLTLIPSGDGEAAATDGDSAAMVLDALDEMYDFIVVCGPAAVAADLFAAVQGRFDAGVLVAAGPLATSQNGGGTPFLGFDVPDFPVLGVARSAVAAAGVVGGAARAPRRGVPVIARG